MGKDKSVISRELKRNSSKRGYPAHLVQEYADERKKRYRLKRRFTDSIRKKSSQRTDRRTFIAFDTCICALFFYGKFYEFEVFVVR